MSDETLRLMLTNAVEKLRTATDLTMDELIGMRQLPSSIQSADLGFALGVVIGAATAVGATPRELLIDHDLLIAAERTS